MRHDGAELEQMRAGVSCAVLLERAGYELDKRESTRKCLKYRRGAGGIVIVNHDGRGWWDPHRPSGDKQGRGDVFALAQYLDPGLNFGQVRKRLRDLVGLAPSHPPARRRRKTETPPKPPAQMWRERPTLAQGSPAWRYLTGERRLHPAILAAAGLFDAVREGPKGSAWFAHRDHEGRLTCVEMRGPDWRGCSEGGEKGLFRLPGGMGVPTRLAACEAPIDALSLADLEALRADTLYVSTTGGMGPLTLACLEGLLRGIATRPGAVLVAATDADAAGERYAKQLAELAQAAGVRSERLRPPSGHNDWNEHLQTKRAGARPPPGSPTRAGADTGHDRPPPPAHT